jgi:hypothetical protein
MLLTLFLYKHASSIFLLTPLTDFISTLCFLFLILLFILFFFFLSSHHSFILFFLFFFLFPAFLFLAVFVFFSNSYFYFSFLLNSLFKISFYWRVPENVTHAGAGYKLHTARGPEQALFKTYTTKTKQEYLRQNEKNINSILIWLWENIRRL